MGNSDPLQQSMFANPFAGERVQGRTFTPDEVKERLKMFGEFFGVEQSFSESISKPVDAPLQPQRQQRLYRSRANSFLPLMNKEPTPSADPKPVSECECCLNGGVKDSETIDCFCRCACHKPTPLTGGEEMEKLLDEVLGNPTDCSIACSLGETCKLHGLEMIQKKKVSIYIRSLQAKNKELTDKLKDAEHTLAWALKSNPSSKQRRFFESTLKSIRSSPPESAEK